MQVGQHHVHRDGPPLIIAEIGVNHDGDLSKAKSLIDAAKSAAADAVKFQLFDADLLLSADAGLVAYQKSAADSAHDLLKNLQLSVDQIGQLVQHAHSIGIAAIVTPFSPSLVKPCAAIGVDAIKFASPDLVHRPLIEEAMGTKLPMILSTGQATLDEIKITLGWLGSAAGRAAFLHCISSYPTPPEHATLGAIAALRSRWTQMAVGYSDHTVAIHTGALAVAAGACVLEKHFTYDKTAKGPDHAASLEGVEFAEYAKLARAAYIMRGPFEKKPQPVELETRQQTRQSLVTTQDLTAGTVLTADMLTTKRPGTGIPAADLKTVLGKKLKTDIAANRVLTREALA